MPDAAPSADRRGFRRPTWVAAGVALLLAVGLTTYWTLRPGPARQVPTPAPSPLVPPTSRPATVPVSTGPTAPGSFFELVKADFPALPATRPYDAAGQLEDAARIILKEPVYLDPAGRLWITRPDAPPAAELIRKVRPKKRFDPLPNVYVVRERVSYVHYAAADDGGWTPTPIVRDGSGDPRWLTPDGPRPLPGGHAYDFPHAFSWGERVVVPMPGGASVLTVDSAVHEAHVDLLDPKPTSRPADLPPTRFVNDAFGKSLLAWVPWEKGKPGGRVARYADGKWTLLDSTEGIVPQPVQLAPLLDGSLLQIGRTEVKGQPRMDLTVALLDAPPVDEAKVLALVRGLSAPRQTDRDAAYAELTQYGPSAWPVLQRVADRQPPEARIRIKALLGNVQRPTLGDMTPADGPVQVVSWLADGGVVLFLKNGVTMPDTWGAKDVVAPAWVSVRPGRAIQLLPQTLTETVNPDRAEFHVWGDETLVTADADGPQRFYGNHRRPILEGENSKFSAFVGIDADGRWLFRRPNQPDGPTLILDPRLPDPTPRLPVWSVDLNADRVGRSADGWPVFQSGGTWALEEFGWVALKPEQVKRAIFGAHKLPATLPLAASQRKDATPQAATRPQTRPSTRPTTFPAIPPLLIDEAGTHYYGGLTSLRTIAADGKDRTYDLPPTALGGDGDITLLRAPDGRLYLFNQPGRVVRLWIDPKTDKLTVEGVFTEGVPNADVEQIWLDPAGRIAVAHDTNRLTLLFPTGRVPPALRTLMVQ